ncbi:MAG: class I SAM-dependent methyltransferase [Terriglobales bacterium]
MSRKAASLVGEPSVITKSTKTLRLRRPRLTFREQIAAPIHDFPIRDEILYQFLPGISGLKVAEIGPGSGFTAYCLLPYVQEMLLIDFAEATIQDLRQKLAGRGCVKLLQSDITSPEMASLVRERYDLIFGLDVFECISDSDACLRNLWELLDADGVLFLTFPNQPPQRGGFALCFQTTEELAMALRLAGFSRWEISSVALNPRAQRVFRIFHEWPARLYRRCRAAGNGPTHPQTYELTWAFQNRGRFARAKPLANCYWLVLGALLGCTGAAFRTRPLGNDALNHQLVVSAFK